jgi:oligosaccharide repeat unit polymerase
MINSFGELGIICLQTLVIFVLSYFIYRKYIISVFDPLFFFLITQAFSIMMALIQIEKTAYLINFLLCVVLFTTGFIAISPKAKKIDDYNFSFPAKEVRFVNYFNFFAFLIIVLANLILISQKGSALFSDDPSLAKFSNFDEGGGFGAIRRINWGLGNLINVSLFFTYFKTGRKRNLVMLLVLFLFACLSGGKGIVLSYIALIGIIAVFKKTSLTSAFRKITKIKIPLLVGGIVLAVVILMKGSSTDNSSAQDGLIKLGIRFLYFGDAIIYYYTPNVVAHFQHYNVIDFINYEFNGLLGLLRIVEYKKPLGNELLLYYINDSQDTGLSIGPNLPYYVSGYIFFGSFGAIIYSFIVGMVVGFVRRLLFSLDKRKLSFIAVILIVFLNVLIFGFPQDTQLVISMVTDTLIFGSIPVFLAVWFCSPSASSIHRSVPK